MTWTSPLRTQNVQRENQNYSISMNSSANIEETSRQNDQNLKSCDTKKFEELQGLLIERLDCFVKSLIPIMETSRYNILIFPGGGG